MSERSVDFSAGTVPLDQPIEESEETSALHAFAQASPVGLYRTDDKGRCTDVNARWCELTGLTLEQALGNGWLAAIHPDDHIRVAREWEAAWMDGRQFRCEYRYRRPDGRIVWILGKANRVYDAAGKLIGFSGSATDVTELHSTREALVQARAEVEAVLTERTQKLFHTAMAVEASGDAIIIADRQRKIVSWNKAAEEMFGWTAAEMIGQSGEVLVPPELSAANLQLDNRVRQGERIESFETIRRVRSGAIIEVSLSAFPLRDARSKIIGTCSVMRNVTDLRRAERRLERLSRRLLRAQDEERRRLARELHDSAAQTVVALSMNLARLAQPGQTIPKAQREELMSTCMQLAASATRELRTTVYVLHPPMLDERGLAPALEWFVGGFQTRSGISVKLQIDPLLQRLTPRVELALFRVAQESLSNVHRHSGATSVTVRLRSESGACVLEVADAGRGLAPGARLEDGVGVSGMRQRLAELGGSFDIQFTPKGTIVTARMPLSGSLAFPEPCEHEQTTPNPDR